MLKIIDAKIHSIPVNHRGNWVLLEIESADHHKGWGEASDSQNETECIARITRLIHDFKGREIDPIIYANSLIDSVPNDRLSRTPPSAIAQALYDITCRAEGISLAEKLSQNQETRDSVKYYCNINRSSADRKPTSIAEAGYRALKSGCKHIKIAPFDELISNTFYADAKKLVQPGIKRLEALREAVGNHTNLMIDCHWRFTKHTVPILASICKELKVTWVEDPIESWDKDICDELRASSEGRICGGEDLYTYQKLEALAKSGCVDVLIADMKFVGGPGKLDAICKMASNYGLSFAPHNPSGPICTAASAQVVAANHNAEILEFAFGEVPWRSNFAKGERLIDSNFSISGPGIGIDIDFSSQGKPNL